jgi:hypothetical protein
MTAISIAALAFACIFGAALLGMAIGRALPNHHAESSSKDVVRLAMAMIATMTALVLGLVTASAKSSFDTEDAAVRHTAADVMALDRMLARYGPETKPIRDEMRALMSAKADQVWGNRAVDVATRPPSTSAESLAEQILLLTPTTEVQRWYQSRALELTGEILQTRWIVFNGSGGSVPAVFLVVLIFWLSVLFGSFGLFAPRNLTVGVALAIGALSVAASIFLILEMDQPFSGVMRISEAPVRFALSHIDQ